MNHPDSHLGADEVRDPAPVPSGSKAGCASQPEEVAARPATPPDGPRSLFPDARALYAVAMERAGFDPVHAEALIRAEWIAGRDQMSRALVKCQRQARIEKSQTTL